MYRFIAIHPQDSDLWTLKIQDVTKSDQGLYECHISSTPKKTKHYNLTVIGKYLGIAQWVCNITLLNFLLRTKLIGFKMYAIHCIAPIKG